MYFYRTVRAVQLYNRGRKKEETMPGTIKLIIGSFSNTMITKLQLMNVTR